MSGAVDVSGAVSMVSDQLVPVGLVGVAVLGLLVLVQSIRWLRGSLGGLGYGGGVGGADGDRVGIGEVDPYDGYTAADDARDRMAAGLAPNPNWDESYNLQVDREIDAEEAKLDAKYGPIDPDAAALRQISKDHDAQAFESLSGSSDKGSWDAATWSAYEAGLGRDADPMVDRGDWSAAQWSAFERGQRGE